MMTVKAALSVKGGDESLSVIGSSVTHAFVSDTDKSNNERDGWSPFHSSVSLGRPIPAVQRAVVTRPCSTHLALKWFYHSNGTL